MNKTKVSSVYGKCGDFTTWKVDIMCRLIDSGKFTRDETAEIISAIQTAENEKKHVGYWVSSPCGNAKSYACSNCNHLLLPDIRPERPEDPPFNVSIIQFILLLTVIVLYAVAKCRVSRACTIKKEWLVKWDD